MASILPPRTRSARVVGVASTPDRKTRAKPQAQTITIPGANRPTVRRSAKDVASGLSAYLVQGAELGACNISVSLKRDSRLVGTTLKGHRAPIVDMEFLAALAAVDGEDASTKIGGRDVYTLGTCDKDGVVFLWFLEVVKNALNIETALKVVRKYSFYSLRKKKEAHYSRIRLAGTTAKGNMVLVPNDGSNVRVISFGCDVRDTEGAVPAIMPPPERSDVSVAPLGPAVGVAGAAVAGAGATVGPRVDSVSSLGRPSSKERIDGAMGGLRDGSEDVFGSDSSETDLAREEDDVEEYLEESDVDSSEEEDEEEYAGEDDYGADEVVDDAEDTDDAESVEYKDAIGKPQAHMAT